MNLFTKTIDVAEIHEAFDTAQDRLLEQANSVLGKATEYQVNKLIDISKRLESIGFSNAAEVKKAKPVVEKTNISKDQAKTIAYYKQTYPFLKFLTETELDRICDKYGLIYAPSQSYIGSVPEKNLADIEKAQKLNQLDVPRNEFGCKFKFHGFGSAFYMDSRRAIKAGVPKILKDITFSHWGQADRWIRANYNIEGSYFVDEVINFENKKEGLFIAAPPDHFDTTGLEKKGKGFFNITKTVVKDPIVFRYVRGGIQVLTKWGKEANDELLALDIDN